MEGLKRDCHILEAYNTSYDLFSIVRYTKFLSNDRLGRRILGHGVVDCGVICGSVASLIQRRIWWITRTLSCMNLD